MGPAVPTVRIRPRTDADVAACARLLAQVHRADRYPTEWPADPAGWLRPPTLLAGWVAETGDGPVGHALLCTARDDAGTALWCRSAGVGPERLGVVSRLFTAPAVRRTGLGRRLLDTVVAEARRRRLVPVLDVYPGRGARAFYERLGWRPVGTVSRVLSSGRPIEVTLYRGPDTAVGSADRTDLAG